MPNLCCLCFVAMLLPELICQCYCLHCCYMGLFLMCLFARLLSGNCLLTCLHCCSRLPLMKSRRSGKGLRSVGSKHCPQGCFTVFPLSHLHSDKKEEISISTLCCLKNQEAFWWRKCVCVCLCLPLLNTAWTLDTICSKLCKSCTTLEFKAKCVLHIVYIKIVVGG